MRSQQYVFGSRSICVPMPSYPPGAAAYEHQRSIGVAVLEPASSTSDNVGWAPATADRVWPCAQLLAEWLFANAGPIGLAGRSVLELGAGCGLPGLTAWAAGAGRVCLTDVPENLPRLAECVSLNSAAASVAVLDWTAPLPLELSSTSWDIILASDCVFWPTLFEPLLSVLGALCPANVAPAPRIFLAMTDRLGRVQAFAAAARAAGWALDALPCPLPARPPPPQSLETLRREACGLYELHRAHTPGRR